MALKWLSVITGFFYMVLGVLIIWKQWFFVPLEKFGYFALGSLMIAYGIFRIARTIYAINKQNNEE